MALSSFQIATRLARCQPAPGDPFAATSVPLYQTATFVQESAEAPGPYDYSRSGNPTRAALERQLAGLEGAERALAYNSGAEFLAGHPAVRQIYYPGLSGHPGHEIHRRQATGDGCLASFATGSLAASLRFTAATRLFPLTVSFGSVASTASLPGRMSHACIPPERRAESFPEDLVRLSIGIEDVGDLLADLERGLRGISDCYPSRRGIRS
jgi:cystathionine beta-lyase/cystathionine gamma-synthase